MNNEIEQMKAQGAARRARTDMGRNPLTMRAESIKTILDEISDTSFKSPEKQIATLEDLKAHVESCISNLKLEMKKNEKRDADTSYEPTGD
jgi:hypothetical protein